MIKYGDLEKHFTAPKIISPFYKDIRISRKLKKEIKKDNFWHKSLTNGQILWHYLYKTNYNYHSFLIKQICKQYEHK